MHINEIQGHQIRLNVEFLWKKGRRTIKRFSKKKKRKETITLIIYNATKKRKRKVEKKCCNIEFSRCISTIIWPIRMDQYQSLCFQRLFFFVVVDLKLA